MKSKTGFSGVQMKWLALLAGAFCLSISAAASANPCADDAAKFCADVEKGKGRKVQCLKEHQSELSPACKEGLGKMKGQALEMKDACRDDAKKLCQGMKPGDGKFRDCMKQHEAELSPSCKEEVKQAKNRK